MQRVAAKACQRTVTGQRHHADRDDPKQLHPGAEHPADHRAGGDARDHSLLWQAAGERPGRHRPQA